LSLLARFLLRFDDDEVAVEVRPLHAADIAATLPGIEQQGEGELELVGRAVEEALADARRPRKMGLRAI
jgi:hypothetical protein